MARRKRRTFTPEFKADAVRLVTSGSKTVMEVSKQFDILDSSLREWMRRAEANEGSGPLETLTTSERAELVDLRKRLKRAEMERDILKNTHGRSPTSWKRNSVALRGTSGPEGAAGCFLAFSNP